MLQDSHQDSALLVAALATDGTVHIPAPSTPQGGKWFCRECGVLPNAASAADATHYSTITFYGSDGSTSLGALTTATVAMAVGTRRTVTPSGTAAVWTASTTTTAGVKVVKTHSGNGVAINVMAYAIFEKIRE